MNIHEYICIYIYLLNLQGEASTWVVDYSGVTLFEMIPTADEFLAGADVSDILQCGLIPTFDRWVCAVRTRNIFKNYL